MDKIDGEIVVRKDYIIKSKNIKIGDVVQLCSGGPCMTVSGKKFLIDVYYCQWFYENKLYDGFFNLEALNLVVCYQ